MTWEIIFGTLFEIIFIVLILLIGALLFGFAAKRNAEIAGQLALNIIAGITGGFIVYQFLSYGIKNIAINVGYTLLLIGLLSFVIAYTVTPKQKKVAKKASKLPIKREQWSLRIDKRTFLIFLYILIFMLIVALFLFISFNEGGREVFFRIFDRLPDLL